MTGRKRLFLPAFCLLVLVVTVRAGRAQWTNSLKPVGPTDSEVKLVTSGKPVCAIQIATQSSEHEEKAAEELQHWIKEITAVNLEITTRATGSRVRIVSEPQLGDEGYRIAIEKGDVILAGGTRRGVVNAVYALLEEDLGCRFYTGESIKLPKSDSLSVRPVARTYVPQLKLRDPFYKVAFDADWSLRNRTNSPSAGVSEELGGHVDYDGLFVHTHGTLLPPATYFKDHPDYFALNAAGQRYPGQLCATHPEVARIVTENVLKALKDNPSTEIVSVSKNDNSGDQICNCERCKAIRAADGGSDIGCQLILVNAVAEAVEKEHPKVVIDTLAYLETLQPPKTIRPRKNVAIRLCNDVVGAWSRPFTPAEECEVAKVIGAWSRIQHRIYIWDYNVNFSHYLAPMPNIDVMASNIRFWVKNNAEGVMLQGGYQGPAEFDEMKAWVTSKLLWDPSRDEKALVQDFIWGHYGASAPAIAEYETMIENLRQAHSTEMAAPPQGIRYPMEASFLTKEFLDKSMGVFARARQLASNDADVMRRVERAELPVLYVRCCRGPEFIGEKYGDDVAQFELIARGLKLAYLEEGAANFEAKVAEWKARIPKPAPSTSSN